MHIKASILSLALAVLPVCSAQVLTTHVIKPLDYNDTRYIPASTSVVYASTNGVKCDGTTDDTAAILSSIALASSQKGVVQLPTGTCRTNIVLNTGSQGNVTLRGTGRRSTLLTPVTCAPVITIDSTSSAIQSVKIEDLGFVNNGCTGQPAIWFNGPNLTLGNNGSHLLQNLFFCGPNCTGHDGFYNTIKVSTGVEETVFRNLEIDADQNNGIEINGGASGAFNANTFDRVLVQGSAANGIHITSAGTAETTTNAGNVIINSVFQNNGANGLLACNASALSIIGSYFETNTANNLFFPGSDSTFTCQYQQGLDFGGNFIWGAGGYDLVFGGAWTSGLVHGNFFGSSNSIAEQSSWTAGIVQLSGNWDQGARSIIADGSGNYHLAFDGATPPSNIATAGTITPNVQGLNFLNFTNSAPATITNFTSGTPGQEVTVFNGGSSTVAFSSANTGGIFFNGITGVAQTLVAGQSATFRFNPTNSRWVWRYSNGPLVAASVQIGLATVIPSTTTGYHGSTGGQLQMSDGSGTLGHTPKFDTNGALTDGPLPVLAAALVTTAATTDNVTVTGMTASGHCALLATNAAAATNLTTTYVSAKTTNQVTVTHVATASLNYDLLCTAY